MIEFHTSYEVKTLISYDKNKMIFIPNLVNHLFRFTGVQWSSLQLPWRFRPFRSYRSGGKSLHGKHSKRKMYVWSKTAKGDPDFPRWLYSSHGTGIKRASHDT